VPSRVIVQGEALAWMASTAAAEGASVITSLPDVSELSELGFEGWRAWFMEAARRVIRWVPDSGVVIFYQSDVRHAGAWVDKGYLVMRAAEEEGASIAWHKIVCRRRAGTPTLGRASYSHMICVTRTLRAPTKPTPDVLPDAGKMPWSRAMGVEACRVACRYLIEETSSRVVVDPFCGRGTVLAIANELGLDAIGVDTSAKRCRAARALAL
jgi:DNA methylase